MQSFISQTLDHILKTTPSFDLETDYNQSFETAHINAELLEK